MLFYPTVPPLLVQPFAEHLCETSAIQNLSVKNPEQQLATMAEAIIHMGQNINQFYKDVKYR